MTSLNQRILTYLKKQPPCDERDGLIVSLEARMPQEEKPHPCRIRFNQEEWTKRYPYALRFIQDGAVCAGCGGYNDRGYSGYMGDLCYDCYEADMKDYQAKEASKA